jgi:hypothetical protein
MKGRVIMKESKRLSEVEGRFATPARRVGVFLVGVVVVLGLTAAKLAAAGAPVNLRSAANFAALVGGAVFLAHGLGHLVGILGLGQALRSLGFRPQPVNGAIPAGDRVAPRVEPSWAFAYEVPLEQKIA